MTPCWYNYNVSYALFSKHSRTTLHQQPVSGLWRFWVCTWFILNVSFCYRSQQDSIIIGGLVETLIAEVTLSNTGEKSYNPEITVLHDASLQYEQKIIIEVSCISKHLAFLRLVWLRLTQHALAWFIQRRFNRIASTCSYIHILQTGADPGSEIMSVKNYLWGWRGILPPEKFRWHKYHTPKWSYICFV